MLKLGQRELNGLWIDMNIRRANVHTCTCQIPNRIQ